MNVYRVRKEHGAPGKPQPTKVRHGGQSYFHVMNAGFRKLVRRMGGAQQAHLQHVAEGPVTVFAVGGQHQPAPLTHGRGIQKGRNIPVHLWPVDVTAGETEVEIEELDLGEDLLDTSNTDFKPEVTFEPDADTLLDNLLPRYMSTRAFASLLESAASESAARRTAMKSATDNATELVEGLSREANQARQAQITQEISEIVGGAGALAASAGSD